MRECQKEIIILIKIKRIGNPSKHYDTSRKQALFHKAIIKDVFDDDISLLRVKRTFIT